MDICMYGASSNQLDRSFIAAGEALGRAMAERGHRLVFGGGADGVMGAAVRGAVKAGGATLGIAPRFFNVDGILFDNCTEFIFTDTMRERKHLLEEKSDAFIMAPGGIGTFEEFFETLTLKQIGQLNKPIAVLNVNGCFDYLAMQLEKSVEQRFMRPATLSLFRVFTEIEPLLDYLENANEEQLPLDQLKSIGTPKEAEK